MVRLPSASLDAFSARHRNERLKPHMATRELPILHILLAADTCSQGFAPEDAFEVTV